MITRSPFVEQADGSLTCTITISADEVGKLLSAAVLQQPVAATQTITPTEARLLAPVHAEPQHVGMSGTDSAAMMLSAAPGVSLNALARYAPFQRFVEMRYGLSDDSYLQAVDVLRKFEYAPVEAFDLFLQEYRDWHATQPFANEPLFP